MQTIIYLGSKEIGYQCLQYLFSHQKKYDIKLIGVFTKNQGTPIYHFCENENIPIYLTLDALLSLESCDFLISVQYHQILKAAHIQKARKIAINLHMAPLPEYQGCNQFSFAILNKDCQFGTTIHRLEEGIDSGAIIAEERFPIPADLWVKDLYELTCQKSFELFKKEIGNIIDGHFQLIPQSQFEGKCSSSFHYRRDIEKIKKIDLNWPKEKIIRHLRATCMPGFEAPYTVVNGKKVTFCLDE